MFFGACLSSEKFEKVLNFFEHGLDFLKICVTKKNQVFAKHIFILKNFNFIFSKHKF